MVLWSLVLGLLPLCCRCPYRFPLPGFHCSAKLLLTGLGLFWTHPSYPIPSPGPPPILDPPIHPCPKYLELTELVGCMIIWPAARP